jgi:hypothetical protein
MKFTKACEDGVMDREGKDGKESLGGLQSRALKYPSLPKISYFNLATNPTGILVVRSRCARMAFRITAAPSCVLT